MSHTPGPWHVNAIESKRNRIIGDETSKGWDKLQISSANCTVATVYRSPDARLITTAPAMLNILRDVYRAYLASTSPEIAERFDIDRIAAVIAKAEGKEVTP